MTIRVLRHMFAVAVTLTALAACGGGSGDDEATAPAMNATVQSQLAFEVALSGDQEVPPTGSIARGTGTLQVDLATGAVSGALEVTGITPSAAHIHDGVAGVAGPVVIPLEPDAANPPRLQVPVSATLPAPLVDKLLAGGLYLNVHSDQFPDGEIRGQIVPPGVIVSVSRVSGEQESPVPQITAAYGTAAITVDTASGATEVHVNVFGADDASAAHVHEGLAGENGPAIIALEKDPIAPGHWASNAAILTSTQIQMLQEGGLYTNVHTAAAPEGLVRGQLLPRGVELVLTHLTGAQEAPPAATSDTARAFTTVNVPAKRLTTHVHTIGLEDANAAHIHIGARGVAGAITIALSQDPASVSHWSASAVELTDAQLQEYRSGSLYVNVHTPANPNGEVRGQIELGGVMPYRFAEIQQQVLNASCVSCHSGTTAPLGLRLEVGESHANLVGTASAEVPTLLRVAPGDAPASYLIRKLDGAPGIVGDRMPAGQPPLPASVIDRIRAWINAGALASPVPPPSDIEAPVVMLGAVPTSITGTVTLTATATDNVAVTLVRFRVNGAEVGSDSSEPFSFDWNSATVANGSVTIDAQALDAAGNVGTSVSTDVMVSNVIGPTAFTFTEIQSQIFTPTCAVAGCHGGANPAAGMDLSAPAYDRIVNVPSSEVPALLRIAPGDAANSYLIQKLDGAPGIVGQRMPFGGPFLDQPTIDRIRAWIDAGAPND